MGFTAGAHRPGGSHTLSVDAHLRSPIHNLGGQKRDIHGLSLFAFTKRILRHGARTEYRRKPSSSITHGASEKEAGNSQKASIARTPQELHEAESAQTNQPQAGSLYGSLSYGRSDGTEVRPAIRVSGSEPAVNEYDLAGVHEGNIIVEVTIDEHGNITQKTVLQSLNPAIDHKVLAALEDWHFLPALLMAMRSPPSRTSTIIFRFADNLNRYIPIGAIEHFNRPKS